MNTENRIKHILEAVAFWTGFFLLLCWLLGLTGCKTANPYKGYTGEWWESNRGTFIMKQGKCIRATDTTYIMLLPDSTRYAVKKSWIQWER